MLLLVRLFDVVVGNFLVLSLALSLHAVTCDVIDDFDHAVVHAVV